MAHALVSDAFVSAIVEELGPIIESEFTLIANVKEEIQKIDSNLRTIQAVLNDAGKRRVKEEAVKLWLDKLKEVCSEMKRLLNEWAMIRAQPQQQQEAESSTATWTVWRLFNFNFSVASLFQHRDYAYKIKEIHKNLDEIMRERERYGLVLTRATGEVERPKTTSFVDVSEIQGFDEFRDELVSILLGNGDEEEGSPYVTSIVGMGSSGKTALAQVAFNDNEVQAHFHIKIWICVSDHFDQCNVAREILESLTGQSPNMTTLQSLLNEICYQIQGRKFFIVFDDVWTEDSTMWDPFRIALKHGANGSRILVTTRKQTVAEMMRSAHMINLPSRQS